MNIGFLIHPYSKTAPGGLGRANAMLAHATASESPDDQFTFYVKEEGIEDTEPGKNWRIVSIGKNATWRSGILDASLDAYVFFTPIMPLLFSPKKSVVIALDFAFLEVPVRSISEWLSKYALYALQAYALFRATKILAISQATKDSAVQHFGIAPGKIEVVHIGFMPLLGTEKPVPVPKKFMLFAGVLKPRKNVRGVILAFAEFQKTHPEYKLLIAGKTGGPYHKKLESLVRARSLESSVEFLGYVSDDELKFLYASATALVFPSMVEGFGMPVLEAMQAGLPVVTSNQGSLAEIAGDAAVLVNPYEPSDIARGMGLVADSKELRQDLISRGRVQASRFSWEKAARALRDMIHSL